MKPSPRGSGNHCFFYKSVQIFNVLPRDTPGTIQKPREREHHGPPLGTHQRTPREPRGPPGTSQGPLLDVQNDAKPTNCPSNQACQQTIRESISKTGLAGRNARSDRIHTYTYIHVYKYMNVCMCVCVYIYICISMYIYIHVHVYIYVESTL